MARKAPRRTAERILETTLDLFNRFGEPNVSTTLISAELRISPGNLYYHYPAKDELVNALWTRFEQAMEPLLAAAGDARDVEDAWFVLHSLFERIWDYRFLYRDINDLLSRNRLLEARVRALLQDKERALRGLLGGLSRGGALAIEPTGIAPTAASMTVVLTWWLSYEYVQDPRHALEPANAQAALMRGAHHVLQLLVPYLAAGQRNHLLALAGAYRETRPTG